MMMFSLRPMSPSDLDSMAASVRTRVVSWNEAADSHDSVDSEALVMPMISSTGLGRLLALEQQLLVDLGVAPPVDALAREEAANRPTR